MIKANGAVIVMIRNIGVNTHNLTLDTIFNNIGVSNQLTKGVVMKKPKHKLLKYVYEEQLRLIPTVGTELDS